eukprot:240221-Chlamydomonas_euryale.AAC.2
MPLSAWDMGAGRCHCPPGTWERVDAIVRLGHGSGWTQLALWDVGTSDRHAWRSNKWRVGRKDEVILSNICSATCSHTCSHMCIHTWKFGP